MPPAARVYEFPVLSSALDGCIPRCISAVSTLRWEERRQLISDVFRPVDPSEAYAERLAMLLARTATPDCPTRPKLTATVTIAASDPAMNDLLRRVASEAAAARSTFLPGEVRVNLDRVRVVHRDLVDGTVEPTGANSPKFVQAYAWTLPAPAGGQ